MLDLWVGGFAAAFEPFNLLILVAGTLFGLTLGVIPGIGPIQGIAILLPLTFTLDPIPALILLGGVYSAGVYGGQVASILVGTPGDPAHAMTVLDGYPMTRKGQAGVALGAATFVSMASALAGLLMLSFASPFIADLALRFGPPEFFLLAIAGLLLISMAVRTETLKGMVSAGLGMLLSFVGFSPIMGTPRFTFGVAALDDGISFIALSIGLFAISEALVLAAKKGSLSVSGRVTGGVIDGIKAVLRAPVTAIRAICIGLGLGALPGLGATSANLIAYLDAIRASDHPETFGTGEIEGVIASEASNNAVVGTSLIPTLTLAIPGSASTAMLLGALTIQGILPGPRLFDENADLVYAFFASLFLAQILWFVIGLSLTNFFAKLSTVPAQVLVPLLLVVCLFAVYVERERMIDVYIAIAIGVLAYFMRKHGFSPVPMLIAFILTPLAEESFHQAMLMSGHSPAVFFTRSYSLGIMAGVGVLLGLYLWQQVRTVRAARQLDAEGALKDRTEGSNSNEGQS